MSSRRHVLWVSTDLGTPGGVASCARALLATPLRAQWGVRHVATHRSGSIPVRLLAFLRGVALFSAAMVRRPLLVHLHMASYGSFTRKSVLAWLAIAARVPVVLQVHGGEFHQFHDRSPTPYQRYIRATLTRVDAVTALGERWAGRLRAIAPGAQVRVIPNAVRPAERVKQPSADGEVHVVFVGDVSDAKGAFTLLDAWAQATASLPPGRARLTVGGRGELARAEARVAELDTTDSVDVRGWIEPPEVARLLRTAHVLALPSRAEGQPMAVLEAMAHGLCVVASAVGGIPDLIDGGCGLMVRPDDVDGLAETLRRILDAPALRAELGAAAHERVCREFDIEIVWRQFDALYRELVG